jgi:hypothetical protein
LILSFINTVSDPTEVATAGTPQNLAAQWLLDLDPAGLCPQDPNLIQRYVLAVFYYSTRGDRWTQCSAPTAFNDAVSIQNANDACNIRVIGGNTDAWLTPSSECDWGGLACDGNDFLVRIDFGTCWVCVCVVHFNVCGRKNTGGYCTSALFVCSHYVLSFSSYFLLIEQNGIGGTLASEMNRLQNLRFLLLEEGVLTGTIPPELGGIRSLEQIDLNFNLLQGTLPEALFFLNNLETLDLNDNEISGTISTRFSFLQTLSFLQIENNQFTGTIPTQMGLLNSLGTLRFPMDLREFCSTRVDPLTHVSHTSQLSLLHLLFLSCRGCHNGQ